MGYGRLEAKVFKIEPADFPHILINPQRHGRELSGIDIQCRIAWLFGVRVLKVPDSGPKRKLLDATERLVVEKGFDLVSVRDITGAAKANVAAVNYHFGSREDLFDLVSQHIMEPLNDERRKALDAAGTKPTVKDMIAAYVTPLFTTAERLEMEISFFLKLVGRVLVLPDAGLFPALAAERAEVNGSFLDALLKLSTKSPADKLAAEWRFFEAGLSQALLTLSPDDDIRVLLDWWATFGANGFGGVEAAKKPNKDDSQGMLFDF